MDQGWVSESLLEEHDDRLLVNLQDDISLVAETLDELPEGLTFFWTMLARSQSTPRCAHKAQKLLVISQHKWLQK
jgi:hypothetical protein